MSVLLTSNLMWTPQINNKTRQLIGILYRKFYKHSSPDILLRLYISFIRPHLEYATASLPQDRCWATGKCPKVWIKGVHKTWISSYSSLLETTRLPSLKTRGLHAKLCNMFKITNSLTFYPDPPIQYRQQSYQSRSVNTHALVPLQSHSKQYFHSFFFFFEFYCCMEQTSTRHCWKHYTGII